MPLQKLSTSGLSSLSSSKLGTILSDSIRSVIPGLTLTKEGKEEPGPGEVARFSRMEEQAEMKMMNADNGISYPDTADMSGVSYPANYTMDGEVKRDDADKEEIIPHSKNTITAWQAGWNVTNAIQGMFLLSLPYAVLHGGYWAILAMVGIAYICWYTGRILVENLYEEDEQGRCVRVRDSYVAIAAKCWGPRLGAYLVNAAQIVELLMTCILYLVLCGDLLYGAFPNANLNKVSWIMFSSIFVLPCAFLRDLRRVSWLSFYCACVHLVINVILVIYCFTMAANWHWSEVQLHIDIDSFPISLGIITFSYTSQIFVCTLEANLIDRNQFRPMLMWSHIAAALFKSLFGYIGFLTWGLATEEVITNNLASQEFRAVVNIILVVKALLHYPLPFYAAVDLLDLTFFQGRPETLFPVCYSSDGTLKVWGVGLRLTLVVFTTFLSVWVPHFALLMGLIGSFTGTMLSFIWPCVFHMQLRWDGMSWLAVLWNSFIIFIGFVCGIVGMYYSGTGLSKAMS